jgi:hypothetical protein
MDVNFTLHQPRGRIGRRLQQQATTPGAPRIARLSRLMALAIRFDTLLRDGVVSDQATLARLGGVTRARLTQIMDLLRLAPDIQEELLFLPANSRLVERTLRPVVRLVIWEDQRRALQQAKRLNSRSD